jgi:hypothetical protein
MLGFDQVGRAPECGNPLELEEPAPVRSHTGGSALT